MSISIGIRIRDRGSLLLVHHCYNIDTCVSISKPILGSALVLESEIMLVQY